MKDLTKGNVFKLIFLFTLPILLGSVIQQITTFVDSIIIGKSIGKEALAATGEVFPFIFIMVSLVTGISYGANILLSQYYGANNEKTVSKIIQTNMVFLFISSLLITFLGILLCPIVFEMMNVPKDVMPYAIIYTRIYFSGIMFMLFTNTIQSMIRSMGDSKTPFYFVVASNLLNILLDFILVYWLKLGIYGISLAVVLSYFMVFLGLMYYFFKYQKHIKISLFNMRFDKHLFYQAFKIGLPIGLQTLVLSLAMNFVFSIANNYGTNAVAAYISGGRIDAIMFMFAMDISMAFSAFVGQNIGAKRYDRLKKGIFAAIVICSVPVLILTGASIFAGSSLIGIFTNDLEVIALGKRYLLIVGSFYLICSTTYIFGSVFNGAGRTILTLISTIIGWWMIRIPISYYLGKAIGVEGIWWGVSAQWVAEFVFILTLFYIGKWKTKISLKNI